MLKRVDNLARLVAREAEAELGLDRDGSGRAEVGIEVEEVVGLGADPLAGELPPQGLAVGSRARGRKQAPASTPRPLLGVVLEAAPTCGGACERLPTGVSPTY